MIREFITEMLEEYESNKSWKNNDETYRKMYYLILNNFIDEESQILKKYF